MPCSLASPAPVWYNRREVNNLAKTLYCKKCNMDVPEGEACPVCGKTPPASSMRVAWMYARQRALDWMSWNAVMRIAVPVLTAATALGLVLELLLGGGAGVRQLLNSGFLWVMGMLLLFVAAVTLLVFALGGADELYCVVDSRGFHVRTALPGANRVKLWMHGKSAALMDTADTNGRVILSEKDLAWKDIARVQLWTDKRLMLLYSPRWWMKLSVPILLAKWNDVLTMVDEKLGKKKAVELPEDWGHQLPPQRVQEKKTRKTAIETDVIPPQTTLPEDEEDYRPLDEVLEELRGK